MRAAPMMTVSTAVLLLMAAASCDKSTPAEASNSTAAPGATAKATTAESEAAAPAAGTKHDPPIKPEEVAEGHWYCDMGTVHYSRPDKGDGKCASCGMALKHKGSGSDGHAH